MVRKIKITGRLLNIVHRHVLENMNQTSDSTLPTMSKGVFERHTSTGITCDHTFLLPFLYVRQKVNYFPFISPTIFVLSSKKDGSSQATTGGETYALTLPNLYR